MHNSFRLVSALLGSDVEALKLEVQAPKLEPAAPELEVETPKIKVDAPKLACNCGMQDKLNRNRREEPRIPFGDHPLKLERYRED